MRYCFRHSDANWYATLRALLILLAGITVWIVVAGLLAERPAPVEVAQAPVMMTTPAPATADQGPPGVLDTSPAAAPSGPASAPDGYGPGATSPV